MLASLAWAWAASASSAPARSSSSRLPLCATWPWLLSATWGLRPAKRTDQRLPVSRVRVAFRNSAHQRACELRDLCARKQRRGLAFRVKPLPHQGEPARCPGCALPKVRFVQNKPCIPGKIGVGSHIVCRLVRARTAERIAIVIALAPTKAEQRSCGPQFQENIVTDYSRP